MIFTLMELMQLQAFVTINKLSLKILRSTHCLYSSPNSHVSSYMHMAMQGYDTQLTAAYGSLLMRR